MTETSFDVTVCQINTKRHWPKAVQRMIKMLTSAEQRGTSILTLNEISRDQALAIQALPGWDIHWVINDHLRGGSWAGNAVAWRTSVWTKKWATVQEVEIDYRTGKKFSPIKGSWRKKLIKFANVKLESIEDKNNVVAVQAFHYPTIFNSNKSSRARCIRETTDWAEIQIEKDAHVILGGDGNNVFADLKGLFFIGRDGPDAVLSTGKTLLSIVLLFKRWLLSDHNGLLVKIRFKAKRTG